MGQVAGIILAAGASRRMGSHKALCRIGSTTFLDRILVTFATLDDTVVVVSPQLAAHLPLGLGARVVVNPKPERGMFSSLRCGMEALEEKSVLVTPVDCPTFSPATIAALRTRHQLTGQSVIPVYDGQPGHPVLLCHNLVRAVCKEGDNGRLDHLLALRGALFMEVSDMGILSDADTPADLHRLRESVAHQGSTVQADDSRGESP